MTEQAQAAPVEQAQPVDLELQQHINACLQEKAKMLTELVQLYSAFTQKIASCKVQDHIKSVSLQYFDTGFLWIKEAIQVNPIPQKPEAPKAAQPVAEPANDAA